MKLRQTYKVTPPGDPAPVKAKPYRFSLIGPPHALKQTPKHFNLRYFNRGNLKLQTSNSKTHGKSNTHTDSAAVAHDNAHHS
jgi:hypothetical protein